MVKMREDKKYIWQFDFLRILMSLFVVFLHAVSAQCYLHYERVFPIFINAMGRIAVPIFYMISGALCLKNTGSNNKFMRHIVLNILFPLVFFSVFYIIYRMFEKNMPLQQVLKNSLSSGAYYHLPFLQQLLMVYSIALVSRCGWRELERPYKVYLIICLLINDMLSERGIRMFGATNLYSIGYAFLGSLMMDFIQENRETCMRQSWMKVAACFAVYLLCTGLTTYLTHQVSLTAGALNEMYFTYARPLIVIGSTAFFAGIFLTPLEPQSGTTVEKVLLGFRGTTFGIYLIHPFLLEMICKIWPVLQNGAGAWNALAGILCWMLSAVVCLVCTTVGRYIRNL